MSVKTKQNLKILVILLLFTLPTFASAAGLVPCGGDAPEEPCKLKDVFILIARVTNWLLSAAALYATYQISSAGLWMAISQGSEETITAKKKQLTEAVVGFVFAMMAFVFMNTLVNFLLLRGIEKCKIDLTNPLNYVRVDQTACKATHNELHPGDKFLY